MNLTRRRNRPCLVIANWRDAGHTEAGGAEACCEQLARRLAASGRNIVFLTARGPAQDRHESRDGFRVVRLGGRLTVYPLALLWLAAHRRSIDGVIDSQNGIPFFTPLAVRRRTPVVLLMHHVHQAQFDLYFPAPIAAIGRWLESSGARRVYGARAIAAMSPSTRMGARSDLGLQGPIFVVPPGWEIALDPGTDPRTRASRPRVVCVGRLVPHKRTQLVVEAIAHVIATGSDVELHIVGDGPEREELAQVVTRLGLNDRVWMHGSLESAERDRLLSTAWLTVNASQGEGWALTVVEANALGVPVLAFRVPGLRDSIRSGETGWLIEEDDSLPGAILQALAEMDDDERARQLSRRTQQWVQRFSWHETTLQMANLIEAERGRLAHGGDDRRHATDLAMLVKIPSDLIPVGWPPRFRITDRVTVSEAGVAVLFPGTDADSARTALRRAGLPSSVVSDVRLTVTVARPTDHVSPFMAGVAPPTLTLLGNVGGA